MTKRAPKKVPARKSDLTRDEDSLLLRSAESLGRVIGKLQRQVRSTSNQLANAATDAVDALPELPRFDDVIENMENVFGNKRKSASAKVGSQRDPTGQRWSGGPPSGRTAAARARRSSKSEGGSGDPRRSSKSHARTKTRARKSAKKR